MSLKTLLMVSMGERLGHVSAAEGASLQIVERLDRDYLRYHAGLELESAPERALRRAGVIVCRGVEIIAPAPRGAKAIGVGAPGLCATAPRTSVGCRADRSSR